MSEPIKAPATPAYATAIRDRRPQFKVHRHIGQVKNAVTHYGRFNRDAGVAAYHRPADGVFTADMTVYRFDVGGGEYVPWIEIRRGDRRSQHPELMPRTTHPDPVPDDPPEHTVQTIYHHSLTCGHQLCLESVGWNTGKGTTISATAANMLAMSGWGVRDGKWMCPEHKEPDEAV